MATAADPLANIGTPVSATTAPAQKDPLADIGTPVQTTPQSTAPTRPATVPADASMGAAWTAIKALPHAFAEDHPVLTDLAKGGVKSVVQGGNTLLGWLDSISNKVEDMDAKPTLSSTITGPQHEASWKDAATKLENRVAPGVNTPLQGTAQHVGGALEMAAEFFYGQGEARAAFEGLPLAEKMAKLAKATKFVEEHPAIAKALAHGVREGAVGAGQAAVHGADTKEALTTGAAAGAGGAVTELLPEAVAALHTRSAARAAAPTAAEVLAQRAAAEEATRQAAAQQGVKDVVKSAGENAIERYNAARAIPPTVETVPGNPARSGAETISEGLAGRRARAQVGSTAATVPDRLLVKNPIADELGSQASAVPKRLFEQGATEPTTVTGEPTFTPIDAKKTAANMDTFGDVAETLRQTAKPDYAAMDTATGGKFSQLQADLAKAYSTRDGAAIQATDSAIDDLLEKTPGIDPSIRAGATSAWRDSKIFDKLHSAVEGSFNGISEDLAAKEGTSTRLLKGGDKDGGNLQKRIGALMNKPKTAEAVTNAIGSEGVANLYRASHLVSTPELRKATAAIAEEVARQFPKDSPMIAAIKRYSIPVAIGEAIGHKVGVPAAISGPAAGALSDGARWVMNRMIMSPKVGQMMEYAVTHGVTPQKAGALVATTIAAQMGANRMEEQQEPTQ